MRALKERILRDGKCLDGGVLKVDNFINHQMDPILMKSMAVEFVRRFAGQSINKILTIEASGIAPAILVGYLLEGEITETGAGIVLRKKMLHLRELFIFKKNKPKPVTDDKQTEEKK